MQNLLPFFTLFPLAAFALSLFLPRKNERAMVFLALGSVVLHFAATVILTAFWGQNGFEKLEQRHLTFYKSEGFEFSTVYLFDLKTAVFGLMGGVLALFVAQFSRFYMHRDPGFKRFFVVFLAFFAGYQTVIFSGNFETFFLGWEILGITSFVLIGFYRDRFLPAKNAFKVLSFYRLGDVALMLSMWGLHHLFHKNVWFSELSNVSSEAFLGHGGLAVFVGSMLVLAATIKSAQMPFSTWLPRAMEGPTSSSTIFYGSLAVHIGAFLLLRTADFWQNSMGLKCSIFAIGAATAFFASLTASVQGTVKTQIAYASIAQIGLIFIEIALGWHVLALVHFAGNAFLRTYQLLVSPSVLGYRIHDMFFHFEPKKDATASGFVEKMRLAAFVWSVKEWGMDGFLKRFFWSPFKWMGQKMGFFGSQMGLLIAVLIPVLAVLASFFLMKGEPSLIQKIAPTGLVVFGFLLVLAAFSERKEAKKTWLLAVLSQLTMAAAMLFVENQESRAMVFYLVGIVAAATVGFFALDFLKKAEGPLLLAEHRGHAQEHRGKALVFLVAALALACFPITSAFVGVDVLFSKIETSQPLFLAAFALHFLFLELAVIRIFCRVFMGQHVKQYHPIAYRSA